MKLLPLISETKEKKVIAFHGGGRNKNFKSSQYGIWFSSEEEVAAYYGTVVYTAEVTLLNPYVMDCKERAYNDLPIPKKMKPDVYYTMKSVDTDNVVEWALQNGYKSVIFKNIFEGNGSSIYSNVYVVFDVSNIKVLDVRDVKIQYLAGLKNYTVKPKDK